jgi:hypothetical protein
VSTEAFDTPGLTLAPVTPRSAELLHALYAEALSAAAASLGVAPAGAIVLQEPATKGLTATYRDTHGYRKLGLSNGRGYEIRLQTPMCGDSGFLWSRPGKWYGSEDREDAQGRRWTSTLPDEYVTDDFGDLVEVPR